MGLVCLIHALFPLGTVKSPKKRRGRSQLSEEELGSEPIPTLTISLLVRTWWNRSLSPEGGVPSEPQQIRNPPEDRDKSHSAIPLVTERTGVHIRVETAQETEGHFREFSF